MARPASTPRRRRDPPTFDLLPGQTLGIDPANNEPLLFGAEEGPGVLVVGKQGLPATATERLPTCGQRQRRCAHRRLLTVTGSDAGGGILASGYACGLEVSNNRVVGNYGTYGGGIRIGHTVLTRRDTTYTDAVNRIAEHPSQLGGAERRDRGGRRRRRHAGHRLRQLHGRRTTTSAATSRWPTAAA